MLGTIMFCSKIIMEAFPNIHLLGMLTIVYTIVFRSKALIPIYLFALIQGLYAGFSLWWLPYLYIWTVLWAFAMLIPKNISEKKARIVYPLVCAMHGFLYGVLYAPAQALLFGLDFEQMLAWIAAGFSFDIIHGVSNFAVGLLILPLARVLKKIRSKATFH